MLTFLADTFDTMHLWLFESVVQPLLFMFGASGLLEDAYDATMWLLIGVLELLFLVGVIGLLQKWRPVEKIVDRYQVRIDIIYTLIHRLGLFRLVLYFTLLPAARWVTGSLHMHGIAVRPLDQMIPGVSDNAWLSLLLYLLVFDLADYWYHRTQHRWARLWELHAVHHSQRQLTMWSDNRNHLVDDFFRATVMVVLAYLLGVPPAQFVLIVVVTQLLESLSHANARISFGKLFDRVLVSPKYHRHHHYINADAAIGGYNFAVLFPIWDILFGTARFDGNYGATGIHDQLKQAGSRNYGKGLWEQQKLALQRFVRWKTPLVK